MNINLERYSPVAFNPHKHHLGFLKQKVHVWRLQPWEEVEQEILCIGTNLIDVYYGRLSVGQIYDEVNGFAGKAGLTDAQKLAGWLGHKEYRKTMLSDQSLWVVRQGMNPECFLHIHPAKNSIFTVRIRASTLKTVVALKVFGIPEQEELLKLQVVNQVRVEMLQLSPIRNLDPGKGISAIWSLINKQ
jgi:hypothetical protein